MKTLNTWKTVFIALGVFWFTLFFGNWLMENSLSAEAIARRPFYLILSILFFVAAGILGIVKEAIERESKTTYKAKERQYWRE